MNSQDSSQNLGSLQLINLSFRVFPEWELPEILGVQDAEKMRNTTRSE